MTQKKPQHPSLSTAEATNRLIQFGQLNHEYKKEFGESINLKHLEAVLHNSYWPFPTELPPAVPMGKLPFNPDNFEDAPL